MVKFLVEKLPFRKFGKIQKSGKTVWTIPNLEIWLEMRVPSRCHSDLNVVRFFLADGI